MSNTKRTQADILALFPSSVTGAISAQDARDFIVSTVNLKPATQAENTIVASADNVPGLTIESYDGSGDLFVGKSDSSTTVFSVDATGAVGCGTLNTGGDIGCFG